MRSVAQHTERQAEDGIADAERHPLQQAELRIVDLKRGLERRDE
jgi:hypothetical protein